MRPGSKINSARDFFEIDRSVLIRQVKALRLTISGALTEIAMVAAENVFDKRLSAKLARKARELNRMAERLDVLSKVLARAKFPSRGNRRRDK
jgi:hypothetical protein